MMRNGFQEDVDFVLVIANVNIFQTKFPCSMQRYGYLWYTSSCGVVLALICL